MCPIFKTGSKEEFSNYRPISILPTFSTFFEKIAYKRIEKFIFHNDILSDNQYGFRSKHSTYMALLDMMNKVSYSADNGLYSIGVFIDLSKAFDTINHEILCRKLDFYGVRGIANSWLKDYLTNRKQCVYFNDVYSDLRDVCHGVPQGSILGPLLFILYINDMRNCSNIFEFILFADDTNLFASGNDISLLINIVNNELIKLCVWFQVNKLSLNVNKTNYMLFGRKGRTVIDNFHININDVKIERVKSFKFLGVFIDEDLNWKSHTCQISAKICKNIGVINRIRYLVSKKLLKILYFALVHSYLSYCNIVWGNANKLALKKLNVLQKRVLRLITYSKYNAPSAPLFKKYNILKLADIYNFQLGQFVYKYVNNILPKSCLKHIKRQYPLHSYSLRRNLLLAIMPYKSKIRENYIGVSGPRYWNGLPEGITNSISFITFKNQIKNYLIQMY